MELPNSINLHLDNRCNYHCRFCFARYLHSAKKLGCEEWKRIIDALCDLGCKKINFAGGEPTLVPFLNDLITHASSKNIYVSIISNGTGVTESFLKSSGSYLNSIGLSIDSCNDNIERKLGRCLRTSTCSHISLIRSVAKSVHTFGIPLKINTTLTSLNWKEDMHKLLSELNPFRWKVFQVHPILGINDKFFSKYGTLPDEHFAFFLKNHMDLNPIGEYNETIKESYCMITPDGRFYQDTDYTHHYSEPLLKIGIEAAFRQIQFNSSKYMGREGNFFENSEKSLLKCSKLTIEGKNV